MLSRARKHNFRIRSIWIADLAVQGQSGVLNETLIGNDPSWNDHSRDLLHMINLKRDEMPRPIIGLGHSLGANNLLLAFDIQQSRSTNTNLESTYPCYTRVF